MKGWIELCSDVNWEDYHGMWARKAPDGSWYVLKWTNMEDACGDDAPYKYDCEVKRLDLQELPDAKVAAALSCCGYKLTNQSPDQAAYAIVSEMGDVVAEGHLGAIAPMLVECCVQYGLGAPLESFTGNKYPKRIRAEARRYAEQCMRDAALVEERLARPVNAIGSTAAEYGRGDIDSALSRGPFGASKNLMRKLHGLPESEVEFGALQPNGELANVRRIKHSDLRKCTFSILVPEHYRDDGTCKCDDAEHRRMMIEQWEYAASDFEGIPLRAERS